MGAAKGSVPWNAGTSNGWTDKRGYRWLYVTENGKRRARREHRVIVERSIGRRLEPWEVVHHRDGDTSNNSIENLEVVEFGRHSAEHHTGSRKSYDARRSMEAFALMREELKAERALKGALLEALRGLTDSVQRMVDRLDAEPGNQMVVSLWMTRIDAARAAIAKAEGRS